MTMDCEGYDFLVHRFDQECVLHFRYFKTKATILVLKVIYSESVALNLPTNCYKNYKTE